MGVTSKKDSSFRRSVDRIRNMLQQKMFSNRQYEFWDEMLFGDEDIALSAQLRGKTPKFRRSFQRTDYWRSAWGIMLQNELDDLRDPETDSAKSFRLRFRVPFEIYEGIVKKCKEEKWFPIKANDAFGRPCIPLELKILGVFRIIGRSTCLDGIKELTGISNSTMDTFFRDFCRKFSCELYSIWVKPPQTPEEIEQVMAVYEQLGIPGAIGSTDVTHVRWDMCPAQLRHLYAGKGGFPTVAFEVTVDHAGRVLAVSRGHPGARNDKTIVRFDGYVSKLRRGEIYNDVTYVLRERKIAADGTVTVTETVHQRPYLIVDGGYHKWACLICGLKNRLTDEEENWSRRMESVRKDVECFFGRLKGRFRMLKLPILLHHLEDVENVFFTACILHNMLLSYDGLDRWEGNVDWEGIDGYFGDDGELPAPLVNAVRDHILRAAPGHDDARLGRNNFAFNVELPNDVPEVEVIVEQESSFFRLREALMKHFTWYRSSDRNVWLVRGR
jgi:hypothetical protein